MKIHRLFFIFITNIILFFLLNSCSSLGKEDLPDFGIIRSEINSDIQLIPMNYFNKSSNTIGVFLEIKTTQKISINCKDSLEIYFKIDKTWKNEYLPCKILDQHTIDSIDSDYTDPDQKKVVIRNVEIEKPTLYPNNPDNLDYRIDSFLTVETERNGGDYKKPTGENSLIVINPDDPALDKMILIMINNKIVRSRRGESLIFIHAKSIDKRSGLSKPIGAYTKISILN